MAELRAQSPAEGLLPIAHGTCRLTERVPEAITSVMALKAAATILPAPGTSRTDGPRLWLWSGRDQAFVIGPPPETEGCAVTDQTDGWAVLRLDGRDAVAVLARLTPLDLRPETLPTGATARSLLGHANALFHRVDAEIFDIFVFRSMTGWVVHEIVLAMRGVAARADAEVRA